MTTPLSAEADAARADKASIGAAKMVSLFIVVRYVFDMVCDSDANLHYLPVEAI